MIKDMDREVELVQKLQTCISWPKLLYFVMDDWLLVHRKSFDHFNEDGEPFISQEFLIHIKTGRYIHRCQGQKVDHGTAIDLQVLTAKLKHAFQGTKPCLGFILQEDESDDDDPLSTTTIRDFPFRRQTSRNCQLYYDVRSIKCANNEDREERCSPCQMIWQETHPSRPINPIDAHLDGSNLDLQTNAQPIVVDILRIKPENVDGDGQASSYVSSFDSSEAVRQKIYSKAKEVFESHNSQNSVGEEYQANLYEKHNFATMDMTDDLWEDKKDLWDSLEVVANKDNSHSMDVLKASNETSNCIFKSRQSSTTGSEHVDSKPTVPESEASTESTSKTDKTRRSKNRCPCCSIVFPNKRKLVEHARERQKEDRARRKVGCRECGEQPVRTFKELIQHYSVHHPEKLEKDREYLPKTQDWDTMKDPKTCLICDVISNGGILNNRHKDGYHTAGNFSCSTCQEPCLTYYDMMIHNFQAHLKATDSLPVNYHGLINCVDENGKISYKAFDHVCQICSKSFKGQWACVVHRRRDHSWGRMRCKPCGEWSNHAQDISAHTLLFHKDKPEVQCPICNQMIDLKDNPAAFNLHFPTCSPSRTYKKPLNSPFQCQVCGKEYSLKESLNAHLNMHQGIFKYQCEYCEFSANVKHTFLRHRQGHLRKMGFLTEADRMRECKDCGKKLINREALYRHKRNVHYERKPVFQCKTCGEAFGYSSGLQKHKIKVHGHVPKSTRIPWTSDIGGNIAPSLDGAPTLQLRRETERPIGTNHH